MLMRSVAVGLTACLVLWLPGRSDASVASIAGGAYRTCGVNSSGAVACWGDNTAGSLGIGDKLYELSAVPVSGLSSGVISISAGNMHACAVNSSGGASCWGENANGQLGNGTINTSSTPGAVLGLSSGVVQIAPAAWHSCALKANGGVVCWGYNLGGELGHGTTNYPSFQPVDVVGLSSGVVAIASGEAHSCALLATGEMRCWGDNGYGQLGDGTNQGRSSPVSVTGIGPVRMIAAGLLHTCAVTQAGAATCWGRNDAGQLGNGTTTASSTPVAVVGLGQGVVSVAAGAFHSCALLASGSVKCWGTNYEGELGDGTGANSTVPVTVAGLSGQVTGLFSGGMSFHTCALLVNGTSECWGYNAYGQLGDGTTADRFQATPVNAGNGIASLALGGMFTCELTTAGSTACWGANTAYQLGNGKMVGIPTPTFVQGLAPVSQVASGNFQTCAVENSGRVQCWGDGISVGDGTGVDTSVPVVVSGITDAVAMAAGGFHACALRTGGQVSCWGLNDNGQLGDGTQKNSLTPVPVSGLVGSVTQITAGEVYTCALVSGGVYCWGGSDHGQRANSSTSVPVTGLESGIRAISAGNSHTCALTTAGGVLCIGDNSVGGLGNGTFTDSSVPVPVTGLSSGVVAISVGRFHSCALTSGGAVLCWGDNEFGQLGDGTTTAHSTPVAVIGLSSGVVAIAAGANHTCALMAGGDVRCWGYNSPGAAGDGTFAIRSRPVEVLRENASGSIATNDWYLKLDAAASTQIPGALVPTYLAKASGNATTAVVDVNADIQFRAQDVGKPIFVYGYVPAGLAKRASGEKDGGSCVLAQIPQSGTPIATSAAGLQFTANVSSAQHQSVTLLSNVPALPIAGSTVCAGTGSSGSQAVDPTNSNCLATIPPINPGDPLCLAPAASISSNAPGSLSGLWWNANESGWGIDFTQRRNIVFAAWYTYDASGNPKWYVASACTMASANATSGTCSGDLYEVNGPTFFGAAFNPGAVHVSTAGSLTVNFQGANAASMTYTAAGQTRTVAITRQPISSGAVPGVDYTDLWWNPSESGWGMAIAQQGSVMFLAWYVYDANGKPVWYVASNCAVSGAGCSGTVYRTTGPAFGPVFDSTKIQVFTAGTVTLSFSDADHGTLSYTVDGVPGTKSITRQLF